MGVFWVDSSDVQKKCSRLISFSGDVEARARLSVVPTRRSKLKHSKNISCDTWDTPIILAMSRGADMLEKIVKKTGTTPSEQYLSAKADQIFSPLWPYSSLFRDDGCSANGTGKELVDLLLHFNGHIVLFSDKNIAFPADPNVDMAWRRWYKSSVVKSVEQLYGAKMCIQRKENGLFLDEKCQKPFPFDISTGNPVFHLVAVTHNSSEAARKYFESCEGESDGSLKCRLQMDVDDAASHPFTVPGFDGSKTFVHVFDGATLDLVLDELSTATDFIHYLSEKERAVRSGNLIIAMDEKDILASYLIKRSLNDFRMLESETYIDAEDDKKRGLWNKYVTSVSGLH
ncbi:hypothetical protein [Dyella acidiphila]|uniref:Uncharacterized protein n=1 Tax=Dyella acidiphila TaxID=2775866 RepID=A0ABR9GAR0_9GAMM|nr:hypothetical protein [Dyella acidiphila]MBE1161108.1 hypothetical protein [Dyella acidiphila]